MATIRSERRDRARGRGLSRYVPRIWWSPLLVAERKRFDLSRSRIARVLRLSPNTLASYERRDTAAPADVLLATVHLLLRYGRAGDPGAGRLKYARLRVRDH